MTSRSILRWAVRSTFSCSFVVAHVPAPYVVVGVTTASNWCDRRRNEHDLESVPVDVWRTRTKYIGSCAAPQFLLGQGFRHHKYVISVVTRIGMAVPLDVVKACCGFGIWPQVVTHKCHVLACPARVLRSLPATVGSMSVTMHNSQRNRKSPASATVATSHKPETCIPSDVCKAPWCTRLRPDCNLKFDAGHPTSSRTVAQKSGPPRYRNEC